MEATVRTETVDVGSWVKVRIVAVVTGWTKVLKDGEWVNHTYGEDSSTIMEFGKYFDDHQSAEKFASSKPVRRILAVTIKNLKALAQ